MKDRRPRRFYLLIIFPCQMASEAFASATKPQEQKQRHFFSLIVRVCVRNYGEERRLTDGGIEMFFFCARMHWVIEATNVLHIQQNFVLC
jgi:hypothetical protein